jgi:hypothetical protein
MAGNDERSKTLEKRFTVLLDFVYIQYANITLMNKAVVFEKIKSVRL